MKYDNLELLRDMVSEGYINEQKHPKFNYYIYNYSKTTQFEGKWNSATLQARGLILDDSGNIIARPFAKFFNLQEHQNNQIPWHENYIVMEKVDGSLGISYIGEDGDVYIATRGSFMSDQAVEATNILQHFPELKTRIQSSDKTFLFEIVYKENRIVVDYGDFRGLIFLGTMDKQTGTFSSAEPMNIQSGEYTIRSVELYQIPDINVLLTHTKDNFEGYVIQFAGGFMMKVKLDEYVRLHRIMTNFSNVSVWEALKNGDSLEHILQDVPDEFYLWLSEIINDLKSQYSTIERLAVETASKFHGYERAYIARKILHESPKRVKDISGVVFQVLDGKDYSQAIWRMIRPTYQRPFFQSVDSRKSLMDNDL